MKKLATTFGLLALMLIVTSFTTPNEIGGRQQDPIQPFSIGGRQQDPIQPFSIGGRQQDPIQ
ncbi:hypothetical protein, partial [Flavobacterium sp.]